VTVGRRYAPLYRPNPSRTLSLARVPNVGDDHFFTISNLLIPPFDNHRRGGRLCGFVLLRSGALWCRTLWFVLLDYNQANRQQKRFRFGILADTRPVVPVTHNRSVRMVDLYELLGESRERAFTLQTETKVHETASGVGILEYRALPISRRATRVARRDSPAIGSEPSRTGRLLGVMPNGRKMRSEHHRFAHS
jgi:hypothetical protein